MTRLFGGAIFAVVLLLGAGAPPVQAASSLSPSQISAILGLLQAFGADAAVIANVNSVLGGTPTTSNVGAAKTVVGRAPTITSITWKAGVMNVASLTIIGTNLTGATEVDVYNAINYRVGSIPVRPNEFDNSLTVFPGSSFVDLFNNNMKSTWQVRVVTPSGTSSAFSFTTQPTPAPTITSVSRSLFLDTNGKIDATRATISIHGTNLTGANLVKFYDSGNQVAGLITDNNGPMEGWRLGNSWVSHGGGSGFWVASDGSLVMFSPDNLFISNMKGTYQVNISTPSGGTSNSLSSFTFGTASSSTTATPKLLVAKYGGLSNQTISAGTKNVTLGSFTLSADSTGDVRIDTITFSLSMAAWVQNLRLYDGSIILAETTGTMSSLLTSNYFNVGGLNIAAGTTKKIDIRGDISAGYSCVGCTAIQATLTQVTGSVPAISTSLPLQTIIVGPMFAPTVPASAVKLTASPTTIISGGSSTLSWTLPANVDCSTTGWGTNGILSGTKSTGPLTTSRTYTLSCVGYPTQSVTVLTFVLPILSAIASVPTVSISTSPATVVSGSSVTLKWSSTNATSCTIGGPAPSTGWPSWSVFGNTSGSGPTKPLTTTTTYTVSCTGAGGTVSQPVTVTVNPAASCTSPWGETVTSGSSITAYLTPSVVSPSTCTSQTRTCNNGVLNGNYTNQSCFVSPSLVAPASVPTASIGTLPSTVVSGSSVILIWNSTNATSCTAPSGNWSNWTSSGGLSGTILTSTLTQTTTFTLQCTGPGGTASASATVTVTPKPTASALSAIEGLNNSTSQSQNGFSYVWNTNLQIGSSDSSDISALQTALTNEGVYAGDITGGFYNQTFSAVKAFQQKYGINATGFVGPATREKLNSLY